MLVVMALVTTLMASPLFELVHGRKVRARGELGQLNEEDPDAVRGLPGATRAT